MTDLRSPVAEALDAFGLPATVTPPGEDAVAIETTGMWVTPETAFLPGGFDVQHGDRRRVLVLPKAAVPQVPRKTAISIADVLGGPVGSWIVDSLERDEFDCCRVIVIPA